MAMEIASKAARTKSEAESEARATYKRLLTKQRADGAEVPEREVQQVLAAMQVLCVSPEDAEHDAALWKEVVAAQADRDEAAVEAERLGPRGERSFGQELDNLDAGLARDTNALLEPKRVLLARIECFDAAAETLSAKESRLAHARTQVPRLCG
ncbi:MAG: hypothetical protein IH985_02110 [Planctomycetes bacterium]|nr:hypothetical protein [Planctomycetota bacterium]